MAKTSVVGAQIDSGTKHGALLVLHRLDISISEAIRLYFEAIVEHQGIPFDYSDDEE